MYLFSFFIVTATTEFYTLSLHDALPISRQGPAQCGAAAPAAQMAPGKQRNEDQPGQDGEHRLMREGERLAEKVDRKSTRLNSSHMSISYAVFCLKKKTVSH